MYGVLLLLHVLGATVWTGGHIVLSTVVLPGVLRDKSPERLLAFESVFEKIGMPALLIQIITGLLMAHQQLLGLTNIVNLSNPVAILVLIKLGLLLLTFCFALDAKLRVLPVLSEDNLYDMAWHIIPVTLISIVFVVVGVSFRTGWLM